MKRLFLSSLTLLLLLLAACTAAPELNGTALATPVPAPNVALLEAGGEQVALSDFAGKTVLLYFGYTSCPDACPLTLVDLARVQRELDDAGEKMQVVMVTVDPQRDTPEKLAEYVSHFHPSFIGLSGSEEQIAQAAAPFGVYYQAHEGTAASGYLVDHTTRIFVIDPDGMYRLSYSFGTPSEEIIADMRTLLN